MADTSLLAEDLESTENTEEVFGWAKGTFLGGGVSGVVERLPNGYVVKSHWLGELEDQSRKDLAHEARVYLRLFERFGTHHRFVKFISYDEVEGAITMEDMPNGTLRAYLEAHNDSISQPQRHRWIYALAEGMEMLHSADVVHCDFIPGNMLLDTDLELKVIDFGCASMDGSTSSAGGNPRFYLPRVGLRERFEIDGDLFALGSSIFEVLTGKPPYADLESPPVQHLYSLQQFPDLAGLEFADVILDCWLLRAGSARQIFERVAGVSRHGG